MILLAVDTSCHVASAALIRDGVCIAEQSADPAHKHAETVMPLVEALLISAGLGVDDVDLFAVDVGPGSFTGVRIGVSATNAMAAALGKRVVPVDALRTLYEPFFETRGRVCAMIDAGNQNVYAALYEDGANVFPPEAAALDDVTARLAENTRIVGDAAAGEKQYPSARSVGLAAWRMRESAVAAAVPLYLRPSQAERMWKLRRGEKDHG